MRFTDYWMARLILCLFVLNTHVITVLDPQTRTNELITASGAAAWWVLSLLICLTVAGVVDVLINDFMPEAMKLPGVYGRRHLLYLAIAASSLAISGVIAEKEGWSFVLMAYWLHTTVAAVLAYLEMFARHRSGRKVP
ncbi:MAG: hypothetical protein V4718_00555 [Pseudomonadota bacterium]